MKISLNTAMLQNYGKVVGLLALTGLAACAAPPPPDEGERQGRTGAYGPTISIGGGASTFVGTGR